MPEEPTTPKPRNSDDIIDSEKAQELASIEAEATDLKASDSVQSASSQPVPEQRSIETLFAPLDEPKKRKKWSLVAAVVAVFLVIMGAGSALAYNYWYQNPEKVIMDGIAGAVTAKSGSVQGTVLVEAEEAKLELTFDGKSHVDKGTSVSGKLEMKGSGLDFDFDADGVYTKSGDIYFRINNLDKIVDEAIKSYVSVQLFSATNSPNAQQLPPGYAEQIEQSIRAAIDPIVKKVNNRWVKITAKDLREMDSDTGEEYACMQDAMKKLSEDKEAVKQISEIYSKNKFLVIKEELGVKNGSMGFVVDIDTKKSEQFGKDLRDVPAYKELEDCSDSPSSSSTKSKDDVKLTGRTEVWFDQWTHSITRIKTDVKTTGEDEVSLVADIRTRLNEDVEVQVPSNAMTLDQLTKELEGAFSTFGGEPTTSQT